jgi:nicotinamidase-related amidase
VIDVNGKTVLTELHEIAAPGHTALVVVDMQNDLVNEDGAFARQGADVSAYAPMVPRLRALIDAAREAGVLVVFVRATTLPNDLSRSPAQILFELRMKESYAHPLAVVVTGCTTEGCVDSTVRDAGFLDYYPVVPRDCVASDNPKLHDAAMLILDAYRAVVTDSPALARAWRGAA